MDKKDAKGSPVPLSHKNARYTVALKSLKNCDPQIDNRDGVEVKGILYGGRDSDTSVPVQQSFDWQHGVVTMGAALESETTAATLGQEGVRQFNPMSNLDFLSVPIGKYINCHLDFGGRIEKPPMIFSVNYFLRNKNGEYLTAIEDKRVWIKWMELRVNNDVNAIKTPTGCIPEYDALRKLFKDVLGREYSENDYAEQFSLRVPENIRKAERILEIYTNTIPDTPKILFSILNEQKKRLEEAGRKYGNLIHPGSFR